MKESGENLKQRYEKEHTEFQDWANIVEAREPVEEKDPQNLLLFNINNNLKRIADSLEQVTLTFGNLANFIANKRS